MMVAMVAIVLDTGRRDQLQQSRIDGQILGFDADTALIKRTLSTMQLRKTCLHTSGNSCNQIRVGLLSKVNVPCRACVRMRG